MTSCSGRRASMPKIVSLEHDTSPAQALPNPVMETLPDSVVARDTALASLAEEGLVSARVEEQTLDMLVAQANQQQQRYHRKRARFLLFGLLGFVLAVSPLLLVPTVLNTLR